MTTLDIKPSDFIQTKPWDSIAEDSDAETIAVNILKILKRNGDTWRLLTEDEYKEARFKNDPDLQQRHLNAELKYFNQYCQYLDSPENAAKFSPDWNEILKNRQSKL